MANTDKFIGFKQAKPVWSEGKEYEKNFTLGFRTVVDKNVEGPFILKIAASSVYRFFINGDFFGYGPARGPHGFYRVDEWDLSSSLVDGQNIIAIEVVGYNINSYYLLDQPSFLQSELSVGENIVAATGSDSKDFVALIVNDRIQKVQKYSFQRTFVEAYRLKASSNWWKKAEADAFDGIELCETALKKLIERRVEYPSFNTRNPLYEVAAGTVRKLNMVEKYWKDRTLTDIGEDLKGYTENELECILSYELDEIETVLLEEKDEAYITDKVTLIGSDTFKIFDFGNDLTGFIVLELECSENTLLYATFDEILINKDVNYKRYECVNGIKFEMEQGKYRLETIEAYTLKYLKLIVIKGQAEIKDIYIREYAKSSIENVGFKSSSDKLNRIYKAGVETFRQNSLDIFMDCPSRERAGWLCDSFFTARVEYDLTGKSLIEKSFLENFLLPDKFDYLPEGMLPMCYPSDHKDGNFIPNWALWFVIELEEYLERTGDKDLVVKLKQKVYKLLDYFKKFKNEYGLLEKLERWVFVEWSKANDFVQDVNYPSNMLYSQALAVAGRLYEDPELTDEAELIRKVIREQSFDGQFFVDNALREEGTLRVTKNKTEVCQYYAFYFNIATPEDYPKLWKSVVEDFGPKRKETGLFPEVFPANAFIGNYLRLEILSRYGFGNKVVKDIEDFFDYMAQKTGTLWENVDTSASCNHGFASHVVHCLYRDALGIKNIDRNKKVIEIMQNDDIDVEYCEGWLPVDGSKLFVSWRKAGGKRVCSVDAPEGYKTKLID